jgi:thiol-disulfide isomerase/thioredoxin
MEKPEGNSTMPVSGRRYVAFDPAVFTTSSNTRRVLFFYANWCPTCIPAHADFEKNASLIPSDVTVIRVNYNDADTDDSEKALAKQYGITYQHTFVQLGNQGEVITKWNGGATKELLAKIK